MARFVGEDRALQAAVGRVIGRLGSEPLPASADVLTHVTVLPEPGPAWARRVQGYSLWIFYRFDDVGVMALGVNGHPPIPL